MVKHETGRRSAMQDSRDSSRRHACHAWLPAMLALALPLPLAAQAGNLIKLKVPAASTVPQAVAKLGGRLVADYGAFKILEVDEAKAGDLLQDPEVARQDDFNYLKLNAGNVKTSSTEARSKAALAPDSFSGKRLHLVQFAGPVKQAWLDSLKASGVKIVSYLPENGYLVYGDYEGVSTLHAWAKSGAHVQWAGTYQDAYKIQPEVQQYLQRKAAGASVREPDGYSIQLVDDSEANASTLALIDRFRTGSVQRDTKALGYRNLTVALSPEGLQALAAQPEVVSIHAWYKPTKFCERQDMILAGQLTTSGSYTVPSSAGYLTWLAAKGFNQSQFNDSGFVVDVSDSGIDKGTSTPNHFGLYASGSVGNASRVAYNVLQGTKNSGSTLAGCDGHGNLNAHIIAGYDDYSYTYMLDSSGYHYGLGVCPFVKVGSSVIFDPDYYTSPDLSKLISDAYASGARISSNSWGGDTADYSSDSQTYDALVRVPRSGASEGMTIVFAAGNAGKGGASTIGEPATAKNVITVGASENVNPFNGMDGSKVTDTQANNAMDIVNFSSRGPTSDGRVKPDLVAPGTHVSGGAPQATRVNPTSDSDTGSALSCFLSNGDGVSGGPSSSLFFPTSQQWFTASSGTSHSTPAVSGACALVRQYFINQSWDTPSPAMTKAYLMNSVRYMTGTFANDTLPSNNQGMGLLDLGRAFDSTARIMKDQAYTFTDTGDAQAVTGTISDTSKPFRVTLAWTDAPGSTTGSVPVNNLDLTVTAGGTTYKGNVFSGQYSTSGGSADAMNNVESVFLAAGTSGSFTVTVTAANISGDGLTPGGSTAEQDYALVIYNGAETNVPSISVTAASLTSDPNSNGKPDPGETVTCQFTFKNAGTAAAGDLKVSLADSGGVTGATPTSVDLGAVAINGTQTGSFTFTVDSATACGSTLTLTFTAVDGSTTLGTFTTTLTAGASDCAPTITSFTPTAGFTGTRVTITGTKLTGATAVSFTGKNGRISAASIIPNTSSQITAVAPSGFTNGTITVTTPYGTATSTSSFRTLDLNGDGLFNVADMSILSKASSTAAGYVSAADLDDDLKVEDDDLQLWLTAFGGF